MSHQWSFRVRRNGYPSTTLRATINGFLSLIFYVAGAQITFAGTAHALIKQNFDLTAGYFAENMQSKDFTVAISPTAVGSGSLSSTTEHGPPDAKNFPVAPIFIQSTASTGDSESSGNKVRFNTYAQAGGEYISLPSPESGSVSDATSSSGLAHFARSDADTTVLKSIELTRTTTGLLDPVKLYLALNAFPQAFGLSATKDGNASAFAQITLSMVGNIQDLTTGGPSTDLPTKQIFFGRVDANGEWPSPWQNLFRQFLDLPIYTRAGGAHFKVNLGLRLQMITFANVSDVPEPGAVALLLLGGIALSPCRRRTVR